MKLLIAVSCLLAVAAAADKDGSCYKDVHEDCGPDSNGILAMASCHAKYGLYAEDSKNEANQLHQFANLHLLRSYQYLLSSSYFTNYQMNRAGFGKVFRKLSDDAWEKTIGLIKHITLRGDQMNFKAPHGGSGPAYSVEQHEIEALAKALDTQKELAEKAFHIHKETTRNNGKFHDPEISQYLEEEFIEDQAKTIRELAGHTNDLKKFILDNKAQDLSLSLYLFDEYLQKTA